jgi:ATP-dependent exoDNAse (exonuclease V) beta subunit
VSQILDQKERLEALNPTQSFIVQAPAGSGKTGLLTQRFLVLLTHALHAPEECLAITFTRKAAAEMRDRVLDALLLANANEIPPEDPYQRKTWELAKKLCLRDKAMGWDLLNNPQRLKIQTIDALCLNITRQMPVISQFGGAPKIVEAADILYQTAASNLLQSLETQDPWSTAVYALLEHLDNDIVLAETLLAEMLSNRDQWLPLIGQTGSEQARFILENSLKGIIQETLLSVVKTIPRGRGSRGLGEFEEIFEVIQFAAKHLQQSETHSKIEFFKSLPTLSTLSTWPGAELEDLPLWRALCELFLTQEYTWRKTVTEQQGFPAPSNAKNKSDKEYFRNMKTRFCEYLVELSEYSTFRENLQRLCECPPPVYSDKQWAIVETLVQLLPVLTAELSLVFQERGEVDFTEVALSAVKALGEWDNPTDIALGLDYKINHLLVDEFQDTSLTQFRLLEQLTAGWQPGDGKTLFLVGDPMQSIYRFRQADVGLFIRAKQKGIGALSLQSLVLTTNFRSLPSLVEWSNQVFTQLFPKQDDIASSAIVFSSSTAAKAIERKEKEKEERETKMTNGAGVYSVTAETEAETVVKLVSSVLQEEPKASLALLVRSRGHLQTILPALRQAKIDYQGVQLEALTDHPIVQDLLGLTRALIHLGDRIAWLTILRSPYCGLSLEDLWVIANHAPTSPIWQIVQVFKTLPNLSMNAKNRLSFVVPILNRALEQRGRLSLRAWIMETWMALGGIEYLENENALQDAEAFFSVLEEEKQFNFFEVGVLEDRLATLYAKPSIQPSTENTNVLQVMTIHKAKGLEFDTVIVPGVGRRSMADSKKLLLWEAKAGLIQERYLVLAPIQSVGDSKDPIYYYLKKQEDRRASHEMMRLWYVAATRARKRLYWLTHEEKDWIGSVQFSQ